MITYTTRCLVTTLLIFSVLLPSLFAQAYAKPPLIDAVNKKYGKHAKNRFIFMNKTLDELRSGSDMKKLNGVNNFFNDVRYASDLKVYKVKDYWATPWEFLGKDLGDCEDYVISKYFALRDLGVDSQKLYFSYVKSRRFKAPHMVLTYFKTPRSIPLVLDNNNFKIFPANKRKDLIPIYNFNGESLYLAKKKGQQGKKVKKNKAHKKWDKLLNDIKNNKI
jgi:predicted transglutaminase-like cysteine proteinase